jgi:hypothetical protein
MLNLFPFLRYLLDAYEKYGRVLPYFGGAAAITAEGLTKTENDDRTLTERLNLPIIDLQAALRDADKAEAARWKAWKEAGSPVPLYEPVDPFGPGFPMPTQWPWENLLVFPADADFVDSIKRQLAKKYGIGV